MDTTTERKIHRNCTFIGSGVDTTKDANNVTVIGRNIIVPEDMPHENAVYIGSGEHLFFEHEKRWLSFARIEEAYKRMLDTPLENVYISDGKTFRNLGHELQLLQRKVDILLSNKNGM